MPLPTAYTDTTLATYLHSLAPDLLTSLGWSVAGGSYAEIINDTLLAYGVADLSQATNIGKLRAVARYALWTAVLDALAGNRFDFSADGSQFSRSQIYTQARQQQMLAKAEAARYGGIGSAFAMYNVTRAHDPYLAHDYSTEADHDFHS